VTPEAFRKLALRLADAEERSHMGHPDFRVAGRIFATLGYPGAGWAMVKLRPEDQVAFVQLKPEAFVPVKGKWGEQGCTNIVLRHAPMSAVRAALHAAHEHQAVGAPRARRVRRARGRAT